MLNITKQVSNNSILINKSYTTKMLTLTNNLDYNKILTPRDASRRHACTGSARGAAPRGHALAWQGRRSGAGGEARGAAAPAQKQTRRWPCGKVPPLAPVAYIALALSFLDASTPSPQSKNLENWGLHPSRYSFPSGWITPGQGKSQDFSTQKRLRISTRQRGVLQILNPGFFVLWILTMRIRRNVFLESHKKTNNDSLHPLRVTRKFETSWDADQRWSWSGCLTPCCSTELGDRDPGDVLVIRVHDMNVNHDTTINKHNNNNNNNNNNSNNNSNSNNNGNSNSSNNGNSNRNSNCYPNWVCSNGPALPPPRLRRTGRLGPASGNARSCTEPKNMIQMWVWVPWRRFDAASFAFPLQILTINLFQMLVISVPTYT